MSKLLYDEYPVLVPPTLAAKIGLNEAIILQQIHYWIEIYKKSKDKDEIKKHYHDGEWWIFNTYEQWHEQFPFWYVRTIKTTISKLEKDYKIIKSGNYNTHGYDHTKWYTIDYEQLETLINSDSANSAPSKVQPLHEPECKPCPSNTIDYTENTQDFIKCSMVQNSMSYCTDDYSFDVVANQIRKICNREYPYVDIEEVQKIIFCYCLYYERMLDKHHPKMKNSSYEQVIDFIANHDFGYDEYELMIERHFNVDYGERIDYNMLHFFTEGIIENRMYETCY